MKIIHLILLCLLLVLPTVLCAQSTETEQDLLESLHGSDKAALVATYYGTTDPDGLKAIGKLNEKLHAALPSLPLFEAWTNQAAIRQVNSQGSLRRSLTDVLEQLSAEGYTHLLIQPTNIADGTETDYIRHEVESFRKKFKQIRVSSPLLSLPEDYEQAIPLVAKTLGNKKGGNVLVVGGEGGENPSQSAMLDYQLRYLGYEGWFVVSGNGFPTTEHLIRQLKQKKQKKLNLIPFTFASKNEETVLLLRAQLQKAGYKVTHTPHTLGDIDGILDLFVRQALHTRMHRAYDALELKMQESLER